MIPVRLALGVYVAAARCWAPVELAICGTESGMVSGLGCVVKRVRKAGVRGVQGASDVAKVKNWAGSFQLPSSKVAGLVGSRGVAVDSMVFLW